MEIYNETAKTKSGTLRVTKSIGALIVKTNQAFSGLANEKITAHIERANGDNEEIATNIPLNAFISASVYGEGVILATDTSTQALCELANDGAIYLGENETLVISLTDLKSASTYELHGVEMPVKSLETVLFTEKIMLAGQKNRSFNVAQFDEGILIGDYTKVRLTYGTSQGDSTIELTKEEARGVSADVGLLLTGADTQITDTPLSLIGVSDIEIFSENQVNLVLRDIDKNV